MGDERVRESDVEQAQAGNIRRHRHDDVSLGSLLGDHVLGMIELPDGDQLPVIYAVFGDMDRDMYEVTWSGPIGFGESTTTKGVTPMQVIAGQSGVRKYWNMVGAQIRRLRGMLAGKKGAPYLLDPTPLPEMSMAYMTKMLAPNLLVESVNPWDNVTIKDTTGAVRDYAWLFQEFGPITLELAEPVECMDGKKRVMRLVEAQASIGPAVIVVDILREDGTPWEGMCVARGWPGAPALPSTPPETIRWREGAVYGFTDGNGAIGYGLGGDDYYWRYDTQAGVSYLFALGILDKNVVTPGGGVPCDFPYGMGMLGGTEHYGLLRYKFQWMEVDGGEDPEPEPEDDDVIELLAEIRDLLKAGGGAFPAELDFEGYITGKIKLPE